MTGKCRPAGVSILVILRYWDCMEIVRQFHLECWSCSHLLAVAFMFPVTSTVFFGTSWPLECEMFNVSFLFFWLAVNGFGWNFLCLFFLKRQKPYKLSVFRIQNTVCLKNHFDCQAMTIVLFSIPYIPHYLDQSVRCQTWGQRDVVVCNLRLDTAQISTRMSKNKWYCMFGYAEMVTNTRYHRHHSHRSHRPCRMCRRTINEFDSTRFFASILVVAACFAFKHIELNRNKHQHEWKQIWCDITRLTSKCISPNDGHGSWSWQWWNRCLLVSLYDRDGVGYLVLRL